MRTALSSCRRRHTTGRLKQWLMGSNSPLPPSTDASSSNNTTPVNDCHPPANDREASTSKATHDTSCLPAGAWPRILLLDGGVSTHLQQSNHHSCCGTAARAQKDDVGVDDANQHSMPSSSSTTTTNNNVDDDFPHRELWSSSLLMDGPGRARIARGHQDWLEAGANVISTVTYQCHYEEHLWPKMTTTTDKPDKEPVNYPPLVTTERMDAMWRDGIALAQSTIRQHQSQFDSSTTDDNRAAQQPRLCLASSGCYGAALANGAEYTGEYGPKVTHDTLVHFHRSKIRTILAAQTQWPDGIAIETVPSLAECHAIRTLLLERGDDDDDDNSSSTSTSTPCWSSSSSSVACIVSLACHNGSELNDGTPLLDALAVFDTVPPDRLQAVGINCCDARHVPDLLSCLAQHFHQHQHDTTAKKGQQRRRHAVVVYPNSGETYDPSTDSWVSGTGVTEARDMAARLMEVVHRIEALWPVIGNGNHGKSQHQSDGPTRNSVDRVGTEAPVILIGGCCRTSPATIRELRRLVDAHLSG